MGNGSTIPTAVRLAIDRRDERKCLRCGSAAREQHHRQRRREGGHGLENLVSLCSACHRWAHANPTEAKAAGLIVSVYERAVGDVPVSTFYGRVKLTADGLILLAG